MKTRVFGIAVLSVCAVFAQNLGYEPDHSWQAPAPAASQLNPLVTKPEARSGGRKLFLRNCAECHGPAGAGIEQKHSADLQLPVVQQQSDGTLFWKITNGNSSRGMPSFSKLPTLERWQLVLFIRTLKPTSASVDSESKTNPN